MKKLKHIDEHIREVFSEKLGNIESPVSPELWNAVQAKISVGASSVGASSAVGTGMSGLLKLSIAAAVAVSIATTAIWMTSGDEQSKEQGTHQINPSEKGENETIQESKSAQIESVSNGTIQDGIKAQHLEEPKTKGMTPGFAQVDENQEELKPEIPIVEYPVQINSSVNGGKDLKQVTPKFEESENEPASNNTSSTEEEVLIRLSAGFEVKKENREGLVVSFHPEANGSFEYHWDFGDGNTSDLSQPSHTFEQEGEYLIVLRLMDKNQRVVTSEQHIQVYRPGAVVIPNVFTPNGDGSNDIFDPSVLSKSVDFDKVVVFDMKGNRVFESSGERFWDGKDPAGMLCDPGQYQYIITAHDRNHEILEKKGYVTLIR
ncbi:MAG: gliding motility-associated C-terminal domain-containing protein [Flavobacteriales bacterium]|nr:gliding motility-associated C-terminal domain-containing protein [Flavobacteriales bacterium]